MKTININKVIKKIKELEKFDTGSNVDWAINIGLQLAIEIINSNIKEKKGIEVPSDKNHELPIGTKFIYKGKKYIVEITESIIKCTGCGFLIQSLNCDRLRCFPNRRKDKTSVIFREIK
ncbi:MAG: hypothetical protein M0P71_18505 [Melioribacteraceae bacterium]|jgi:hypothetical protein|nr:hypothetical protein [Melioribacteraceae bacterium]